MVDHVDLIGAPFEYGGRGPDRFDCYGLVMEMSRRVGRPIPEFGFDVHQCRIAAMMAALLPQWEPMPAQEGAVALFRIGRFVSHVGFMLDEDRMIHAWERTGGVTVERLDNSWQKRLVGFYRYVGTKD